MEDQKNKTHKKHTVGAKATKKNEVLKRKKGIDTQPNRGNNPKAFQGVTSGSHKAKQQAKSLEKREHVYHMPEMDRTLANLMEDPPLLVAVVGPPGCGKSTLIRSMVKFYSNRNLRKLSGPVTVIAGRSRRVTFIECPNTLNAMCDVSKVADLVLLMVDGNFGFEMETFEFLNIAQVHGFPRFVGIVSHLDKLASSKSLKKRKKFLRHRFWHEVVDGAKMLCLSSMQGNLYRGTDVLKLHQLLICVQPKIQNWRNSHSCMLIDRHEDITNPDTVAQSPDMSRTIVFHGYLRGKPMKPNQMVHIPGLGDFPVAHISRQEDPCSMIDIKKGNSQGHKMRHLSTKQKKLYAPYSDVGGITYDDESIYISEDAEREANVQRTGEGMRLIEDLRRVGTTMDQRNRDAELSVMGDGFDFLESDDDGEDLSDEEDEEFTRRQASVMKKGQELLGRRPMHLKDGGEGLDMDFNDSQIERPADFNMKGYTYDDDASEGDESEDEDDENVYRRLKDQKDDLVGFGDDDDFAHTLKRATAKAGGGRSTGGASLPKSIGLNSSFSGAPDGDATAAYEGLLVPYELAPRQPNEVDTCLVTKIRHDWHNNELLARVKDLFVTGKWQKSEGGIEAPIGEVEGVYDGFGDVGKAFGAEAGDTSDPEDRGYESDDEEFDQLVRGERNWQDGMKSVYKGANGEDDEEDAARTMRDMMGPSRPPAKASSSAKAEKEYDVLADDDDEGFGAATSGGGASSSFADPELQGLVDHFISNEVGDAEIEEMGKSEGEEDEGSDDDGNFFGKKGGPSSGKRSSANALANIASTTDHSHIFAAGALDEHAKKKIEKKKAFDDSYDSEGGKNNTSAYYRHMVATKEQKEKDLHEAIKMMGEDLDRKISLVGFFSGLYVRVVIENVPVEFLRNFDASTPLIMGGLNPGEDQLQIIHAKIKRHRWYPRILKAMDPIMISLGWRRFQTQPIYDAEDPNGRHRYLKYTPLHMHSMCAFYGPVTPANTGFVTIPVSERTHPNATGFRLTSTGYTIGNDECTQVVKKLKLTGTPQKIQKTTVFIKGMFNSDIEAAKFVGAKVKAVSGLRGIIKAVMKGKGGLVRCTFEDKLLMSDVVFLRAWKPVDPPRYCAMAPTLLDPNWKGMRTMRELRRDLNIANPGLTNPDSQYREVRARRDTNFDETPDAGSIMISRNMRKNLPFSLKEDFVSLEGTSEIQKTVMAATTIAPDAREARRKAMLDAFRDQANILDKRKQVAGRMKAVKKAREEKGDEEHYEQKLKKAKKETAKKEEFRSQHKSRK